MPSSSSNGLICDSSCTSTFGICDPITNKCICNGSRRVDEIWFHLNECTVPSTSVLYGVMGGFIAFCMICVSICITVLYRDDKVLQFNSKRLLRILLITCLLGSSFGAYYFMIDFKMNPLGMLLGYFTVSGLEIALILIAESFLSPVLSHKNLSSQKSTIVQQIRISFTFFAILRLGLVISLFIIDPSFWNIIVGGYNILFGIEILLIIHLTLHLIKNLVKFLDQGDDESSVKCTHENNNHHHSANSNSNSMATREQRFLDQHRVRMKQLQLWLFITSAISPFIIIPTILVLKLNNVPKYSWVMFIFTFGSGPILCILLAIHVAGARKKKTSKGRIIHQISKTNSKNGSMQISPTPTSPVPYIKDPPVPTSPIILPLSTADSPPAMKPLPRSNLHS